MKDQDQVFDQLVAANPVPDPRARQDAAERDAPMAPPLREMGWVERRTAPHWWLNPGIAAAAALVVIAGFTLFLLGRGPAQDPFLAGTPTATPGEVSPTTTAPAPPAGLGFIVATAAGVEVIDARGTIARIVQDEVVVALDDGSGGVVYQNSPGSGESSIVHVPVGAGPQVLVSDRPGLTLSRLYDVVEIDGRAIVVYVEQRNPLDLAEASGHLMEYDIAAGSVTEVIRIPGADSEAGVDAVSWDGSRYVVEVLGSGYATFLSIDRDGTVQPWTGALPAECTTAGPCPRLRVATSDGERLVVLDGSDIVVWNRASDSAESILQGEGGDEVRGLRVEWPVLVVNRDGAAATVYDLSALELDPVPVTGFADPVLDMALFPSNLPGEAERKAAERKSAAEAVRARELASTAEAVRARELAELRIDGERVDALACAGVDAAVVYRPPVENGITYIVGFEEGVFVRVLGAGIETETDQVTLMDRADGTRLAVAELEVGGDLVTVEAVVVDGLPECTP